MATAKDLSHELDVAHGVARQAAVLVESFAGGALEVQHKAGGEPVSRADLASSELIVGRLRDAFPGDAILSEEMPDDGSRLEKSRVWMVDPIDGTSDFLRGDDGYVVMIGLCIEGRPVLGVVTQPATGELWLGVVGQGAWKEHADGSRTRLRVSTVTQPSAIRLVASKSHRSEYYARFCRSLGIQDELRIGSVGLKVATVSEGTRDLFVYPGGQAKIWDSCGPEAIVTAAGGKITDTDGQPLRYTQPELRHPRGLLVTNGLVHELALEAVARLRAEISQGRG